MLKRWVCVAASAAALLLVGLTPDVAAAGVPWAEPPRGGGDGDGVNRICIRQEYDPGITLVRAAACAAWIGAGPAASCGFRKTEQAKWCRKNEKGEDR
jgi:hypothetical protein